MKSPSSSRQIILQKENQKDDKINFVFKYLSYEKANDASIILANAFIDQNPIWSRLNIPREQALKVMYIKVQKYLNNGFSFMMVNSENNELAMVAICMDLVDYLQKNKLPNLFVWQSLLSQFAAEIQSDYFHNLNPKRGQYIFLDAGCSNPKYMYKNLNYYFWIRGIIYAKKLGYKGFFARTTNPILTKTMINFGGKIVSQKILKFQDNSKQHIQLLRVNYADLNLYKPKL